LRNGLYYLNSQLRTKERLTHAYHIVWADDSVAKIWLWHQQLGHPSFLLLQCIFSSLFLHKNVSMFQYETCELSKRHHVSFSPSINKRAEPFVLVHTNVWSPSWVVYTMI
jgi:hypothetical protein